MIGVSAKTPRRINATGAPNGRSDSPARLQAAVANLGLGEQVLTGAAEIAPPVQRSVARIARHAIEFCRIVQIDWIVPRLAAEIIRTRRDAEPGGRLPAIQKPGVSGGQRAVFRRRRLGRPSPLVGSEGSGKAGCFRDQHGQAGDQ